MTSSKGDFSRDFGRDAARYAALRPGYPDAIFSAIKAAAPRHQCAVDLGAGSGAASARLARDFARVIAVEPDPRLAALIPAPVERVAGAAEEASFDAESLDAVIAATAFHWMDRPLIAARVSAWLRPGGVFCPFAYDLFRFSGAAHDLFETHLARWAPYRDERLLTTYDPAPVLREAGGFSRIDIIEEVVTRIYSPEEAAGLLLTASCVSAYARDTMGVEAYFETLRAAFAAIAPHHKVAFPIRAVLAQKA